MMIQWKDEARWGEWPACQQWYCRNSCILATVWFGYKKDEVELEEVRFCVNVFWFKISLEGEGHPTHPVYWKIGSLRTVALDSDQRLAD